MPPLAGCLVPDLAPQVAGVASLAVARRDNNSVPRCTNGFDAPADLVLQDKGSAELLRPSSE